MNALEENIYVGINSLIYPIVFINESSLSELPFFQLLNSLLA